MTSQATAGSAKTSTVFVCPFCGLLCDDLPGPGDAGDLSAWTSRVQALCPKAAGGIAGMSGAGGSNAARIDGEPVSEDAAIAEAARRITAARRPLIGGLGGDVQAMRSALALGDRVGARLIHRNQFAAQHNLFAQQSRGAMTTTLAEARQRAEMVVLIGDATSAFPRLLERLFTPKPVFADAATRRLVLLGAPSPQRLPGGVGADTVDCGGLDRADSVALLRAFLRGLPVPDGREQAEGLALLARQMAECRYGVVVWAAADLEAAGADLLVEQLHQLVIDLNRKTRWAALPLAGNDGDLTANAVATWQTGFALPIEFGRGRVAYDPFPDYADADLLIWLGALPGVGAAEVPRANDVPQIVVGAPSLAAKLLARHVFIPVATPGVSASGHLVRTDGVITLYAPAVLASPLPAAATVIDGIAAALAGDRP
jgi:formylmethanofuran dehydrogenase subunit B